MLIWCSILLCTSYKLIRSHWQLKQLNVPEQQDVLPPAPYALVMQSPFILPDFFLQTSLFCHFPLFQFLTSPRRLSSQGANAVSPLCSCRSVEHLHEKTRLGNKKKRGKSCFSFKGHICRTCTIVHAESLQKCLSHFSA